MKYYMVKPARGGQAFWRSVIQALSEEAREFEVRQLWLNERRSSSLYVFPADVINISELRAAAAHLELPESVSMGGWKLGYRTLKVKVRKCKVSSWWSFTEYETTYLEIESEGKKFYVFRNQSEAKQCLERRKAKEELEAKFKEIEEGVGNGNRY